MTTPGSNPDAAAARAPRSLSASAQRVQEALTGAGFDAQVFELEIPVRTAAEAASAVGCEVAQIAKSLIFRAERSGRAVLVITSGANRVNEATVAEKLGEGIGRADPDFVRERTGFAIGGIPPLGHATPLETLIDEDLLTHREVWAAAGHPNALFRLDPRDLARMTGGAVTRVR
jgi:prolyl-tRNA editing enzyme YbaK/EbsC (Cys-tRNA(Pro) deacylase)